MHLNASSMQEALLTRASMDRGPFYDVPVASLLDSTAKTFGSCALRWLYVHKTPFQLLRCRAFVFES